MKRQRYWRWIRNERKHLGGSPQRKSKTRKQKDEEQLLGNTWNSGGTKLSSCMLSIWPSFRAAPRIRHKPAVSRSAFAVVRKADPRRIDQFDLIR
jgi:hypothetical protein